MATRAELRTTFLSRLRRRDCTSALADDFIDDAIRRIQRGLINPGMEKSVEYEIDANTYTTYHRLSLPSDFLRMREVSVTLADGTKRALDRKSLAEVQVEATTDYLAYPTKYARQAQWLIFAPYPLSGTVVTLDYYGEFDDMDDDADETILSSMAPDLVVFGALSYAADHFEDKRAERFEARYIQIATDLNDMAQADELTNAGVSLAYSYPSDF